MEAHSFNQNQQTQQIYPVSTTQNSFRSQQQFANFQSQHQQSINAGADAHLNSLKNSFKSAANSLTQLYKQATFSYNVAYQQGRQDAFEEVFQWFMQNNDGDFKNVSVNQFFTFMQEKLNKQREETNKAQDINQEFQTNLMPPPPNRMPSNLPKSNLQSSSNTVSSAELMEQAAQQSLKETNSHNGGIEVIRKVNINFGGLKLNDSKKRVKYSGGGVVGGNQQQESQQVMDTQMETGSIPAQIENSPIIEGNYGGSTQFNSGTGNEQDYSRKIYKAKRMKQQQ